MTRDSLDISMEKNPTDMSVLRPTCSEMFKQMAVLPIDGRAATMTSSSLWKPAVSRFRSVKPVSTPVTASFLSARSSMSFIVIAGDQGQRNEALARPLVREADDGSLGLVEDLVRLVLLLVAPVDRLGRGDDQPPQEGLLLDDPGVVFDAQVSGHAVHERGQVGRPADVVELALAAEVLGEGQELHGQAPVDQGGDPGR